MKKSDKIKEGVSTLKKENERLRIENELLKELVRHEDNPVLREKTKKYSKRYSREL
jgi:hypothetical protein